MTTIAWDGKILAADKMASDENSCVKVTKIFKHRGELLFAAGDFSQIMCLVGWYKSGARPDEWPKFDDTELCVVRKDGSLFCYEGPLPYKIEERIYAVGTGRAYALAAMHLGKTSRQAVEVACKFDPFSGLGIDVLKLKEKK